MFGIGALEILCLLIFGLMFLAVLTAVVFALVRNSKPSTAAATPPKDERPFAPQPMPLDPASQVDIVARLTQRFCPQCRAPLAADSPEGLCAACLMAGAFGSDIAPEPVNGMVATTPPSGSKPPLTGEIGDLQQHFPQLEILELLGRGGMGAVYKARQKNLDRFVALKVIPPEAAKDPAFAERFNREARALARLNHPCIVTVYDFGHVGELHYLLMEYVDGVNLRQTLRAGRLAPHEALAIVPPICDALQYAHDQGVVHRDIKPENVLLDRLGRVKIADFGLAKLVGKGPDDFTLTRTQQIMGTPRYMAPEQIEKPSTVDHRADIYSLGVVIYEMLTGELPIGRFEPPSQKVEIDVRIDQVVMRSLEKDPQRRYQRASEVKTELASAVSWPTVPNRLSPLAGASSDGERTAQRPSWHTPAHATKSDTPGGVPLAHVLMVAFGMVLGVLLMAAGLAIGIYGLIYSFVSASSTGTVWGLFGAAFGCIVGGFGSIAGSYNTYRQLAGAEDLMRSPRTTWFDWLMRGYLAFGLALLASGLILMDPVYSEATGNALLLLGGIATVQAALFLVLRTLYVFGVKPKSAETQRDPLHEPLQSPGMGLLAAGIVAIAAGLITELVAVVLFFARFKHDGFGDALVGMATTNLVVSLAAGTLMILGGLSMRRARSYSLAIAGCIAGLIPIGIAWPLTMPLALWALLTLREKRVGKVFQSSDDESDSDDPSPAAPAKSVSPSARPLSDDPAKDSPVRKSYPPSIHRRVFGPALALIICGVLLPFPNLALLVVSLDPREFREYMTGTAPFTGFGLVLAIIAASLMVIGGTRLWNLDTYRLAWIGAIAALVPISPLWAFSLPIGLWAIVVLMRPDVQAWFDLEAGEEPQPRTTRERADVVVKSRPPGDSSVEAIRRRVAGPAIGLMIVGVIGLLPCLTMLLSLPALVIFPTYDSVRPGPWVSPEAGSIAIAPTFAVAVPAALLAQGEAQPLPMAEMARGPLWGIVFAVATILLCMPLSLVMIVGGWRMRQLKSYGLATIASVLAMLPCTLPWMIGMPMGLWALIVLFQPEVREAFES